MDMVVDKLQFRNPVDKCCKDNCNPYDRIDLEGVSAIAVVFSMLVLSNVIQTYLHTQKKFKLKGIVIYLIHSCTPNWYTIKLSKGHISKGALLRVPP